MSVVMDIMDEWQTLADARMPWETHWRDIAAYVLPQTQGFDRLLSTNKDIAIQSVVSEPVAAKKSVNIYDMTSLWGIERLTAGMLSLKTPETEEWHDIGIDDYFGRDVDYQEEVALERLKKYMFKVRANPHSGFWGAHRAALRSMCAFGDGWMFVEEMPGGGATGKTPYRYEYMPLPELYPSVDSNGMPNRMARVFRRSALQLAHRFGTKLDAKTLEMANDPDRKHEVVRCMHFVRPRDDLMRGALGTRGSAFASYYLMPDDKHLIGEGGYFEYPFVRYAWQNSGATPFSEGPVSFAIAEIKSLQEMAKNELLAVQSTLRPAYATYGRNFTRLNLNPGVSNPGLISPDGKPLFAPMNSGVRPDFAQAVMEARRNSVREMLYLNLWQIVLQDKNDTATEALIRAQEKGELLGPVGISLNEGLSMMVDREVAILGRKRAFDPGSPLEMPESLADQDVSPVFNSPLDRLRRMGEIVGMQRLVEFVGMLEHIKPGTAQRLDPDEMLDVAREVLGAPVKSLRDKDEAQQGRQQQDQMMQMMQMLEAAKQGGEAANAVGQGAAAMAQGAEVAGSSEKLSNLAQNVKPAYDRLQNVAAQQ